jgi:hypothetical protein
MSSQKWSKWLTERTEVTMKTESKSRLEDTRTWYMPATEAGKCYRVGFVSENLVGQVGWRYCTRCMNCSAMYLQIPEYPCIMPETFLPKPGPMKNQIMSMYFAIHDSSSGINDLPQCSQNTDTTTLCLNGPSSSSIVQIQDSNLC